MNNLSKEAAEKIADHYQGNTVTIETISSIISTIVEEPLRDELAEANKSHGKTLVMCEKTIDDLRAQLSRVLKFNHENADYIHTLSELLRENGVEVPEQ